MDANDPALAEPVEHSLTFSDNPRLYPPEHLTRPIASVAAADRLVVIIDVDALGRSSPAESDRLLTRALSALSHVSVQVVVVGRDAIDRAIALQRGIPRSSFLETGRAAAQLRRHEQASLRVIVISNDRELLATLGPEDRGLTLTGLPNTSHGVMSGESSMRLVLWWLVSLRATAHVARRQTHGARPDVDDGDEPRDPPERDLFDSPSDSWRDLELREMLDQIECQPVDRADS